MRKTLAVLFMFIASPALAQFPPPGIYACTDASGGAVGEWTLLVAGDYSFQRPDGTSGKGQVASAGTDVSPISGPLKEFGWMGVFGTDDTGATLFRFTAGDGSVVECR
jgi:hypothetical protein